MTSKCDAGSLATGMSYLSRVVLCGRRMRRNCLGGALGQPVMLSRHQAEDSNVCALEAGSGRGRGLIPIVLVAPSASRVKCY